MEDKKKQAFDVIKFPNFYGLLALNFQWSPKLRYFYFIEKF